MAPDTQVLLDHEPQRENAKNRRCSHERHDALRFRQAIQFTGEHTALRVLNPTPNFMPFSQAASCVPH